MDMEENVMLRIAVQTKGRLNEQSMDLLKEAGVTVSQEKRKFLMRAADFPAEIIFLRDDDIPQTVAIGAADVGIVGYNEVAEKGLDVDILQKLGLRRKVLMPRYIRLQALWRLRLLPVLQMPYSISYHPAEPSFQTVLWRLRR